MIAHTKRTINWFFYKRAPIGSASRLEPQFALFSGQESHQAYQPVVNRLTPARVDLDAGSWSEKEMSIVGLLFLLRYIQVAIRRLKDMKHVVYQVPPVRAMLRTTPV